MPAAIVAGVGPGLGAALARAFAAEGYAVGLLSRRRESSDPVGRELEASNARSLVVTADVTNRAQVADAVQQIRAAFGPITALAYNAGGYGRGPFLQLDPEQILLAFRTSVMGAVYLAQAVVPDMLAAGGGFISLTGATAALRGRAHFAPLAVAKASLRMLGQSLAREFHPQGIHVLHVIVDGQIDTPRLREREPQRPAEKSIPPDAIASAVIHAMRQPSGAWTHEIDVRPAVEPF